MYACPPNRTNPYASPLRSVHDVARRPGGNDDGPLPTGNGPSSKCRRALLPVIVGGVLRIIPLTGITLPFVSYGGSSIVANFLLLAGLLLVSHRANSVAQLPMEGRS